MHLWWMKMSKWRNSTFPTTSTLPVLHWQRSRGKRSQHRVPSETSTNTGSEMPGMWNSPTLRYAFPPVTTNPKMQWTASNRDRFREWIPCDTRRMTQLCLFQQCLDGKARGKSQNPETQTKKDKSGWPWNVPRVYSYYSNCWWLYGTYCMPGAVLTTSHIVIHSLLIKTCEGGTTFSPVWRWGKQGIEVR